LAVYLPVDSRIELTEDNDALIDSAAFTEDQKGILIYLNADDIANHFHPLWEREINVLKNLINKHVAITVLKHILSQPSLAPHPQRQSAQALANLGEKENAISTLKHRIKAPGNSGIHLMNWADALRDLDEKETAVEVLKYVATDPNSSQSDLIGSARCLQTLGEISAARDACIKSINIQSINASNYSSNLNFIAEILYDLDEKTLAIELCQEILNHPETGHLCLMNCSRLFKKLNETVSVIAAWHKIKTFSNQYPFLLVDSAVAFEKLGEKEAAMESCRQALNHPATRPENLFNICQVLERLGDTASAITAWKKILNQVDDNLYTLKDAATSLERLSDTASATTVWKKLLDLDNISINILQDAAYNLERLGVTAAAIMAWKRCTQYPVEQCWAYILHIVPSFVRLGAKNSAISFCHRFFPDETSSIESLDGTVHAAKFLERLDDLHSAIVMWKTLLNSPQASDWQLAHAFLSFYLLEKEPLAIKACHKILDHPDSEPWLRYYTAVALESFCQREDATNALYSVLSHPDSVKEDFDGAITSLKKIERGQSLNLNFLHELVQYNKIYWDKVFTSKDGIIEEEEEPPVIIESFPNWHF
jgi:tetratricopeptide (TPR) repeat protein